MSSVHPPKLISLVLMLINLMTSTSLKKPRKRKRRVKASSLRQRRRRKISFDKKKNDQKTVDAALLKAIENVPDLKSYLGARFSLKVGVKPHELVF